MYGKRGFAQDPLPGHPLAHLEQPQPQPVAAVDALQYAPTDQLVRQAVHRRLGHAGTPYQIAQRQRVVGGGIRLENQFRLAEDGVQRRVGTDLQRLGAGPGGSGNGHVSTSRSAGCPDD